MLTSVGNVRVGWREWQHASQAVATKDIEIRQTFSSLQPSQSDNRISTSISAELGPGYSDSVHMKEFYPLMDQHAESGVRLEVQGSAVLDYIQGVLNLNSPNSDEIAVNGAKRGKGTLVRQSPFCFRCGN